MSHSSPISVHLFVDTAATMIITVTSVTPTTIVIAIGESTTASADTLTHTVTVNGSGEEVTGSTAFEIAFPSPPTFTPFMIKLFASVELNAFPYILK